MVWTIDLGNKMGIPLKTIVLAEDDATVARYLCEFLVKNGYELRAISQNGIQAVEQVKAHQPHLLLMDIHMPLMNGLEAAKQVIAFGSTAVVLTTADADPETARAAMDLGVCGYIRKPCDISQIEPVLESAWHRFQTEKTLREEMRVLSDTLETRKVLDKAKGILMEQQGFSEEEAHRAIQKMAQDQGITVKELCRSLIQVRMVLGSKSKTGLRSKDAA